MLDAVLGVGKMRVASMADEMGLSADPHTSGTSSAQHLPLSSAMSGSHAGSYGTYGSAVGGIHSSAPVSHPASSAVSAYSSMSNSGPVAYGPASERSTATAAPLGPGYCGWAADSSLSMEGTSSAAGAIGHVCPGPFTANKAAHAPHASSAIDEITARFINHGLGVGFH